MGAPPKHRDNLVASAVALFRRQGFSGTGIADILAASGAPKGSLYHYFPDGKEAIGEAALRAAGERGAALLREGAARVADASLLVRGFAEAMTKTALDSDFTEGCPVAALMVEAATASHRLSDAGAAAYASWAGVLAEKLVDGGVAPDRAQSLGMYAVSVLQGALLVARASREVAPLKVAAVELQHVFAAALQSARLV